MKKYQFDKYFYLGIYFILLEILVLIRNYLMQDNILFFHYCDNIALFLAIAFLLKNIQLIKGLISTGLVLQFIYLIDLIGNFFFNISITGSTTYLANYSIFALIITLLMHLFTAFIALIFTFKEKNNSISLIYSFLYLCFLYFTTIIFTHPSYDTNCIFNACGISFIYFNYFTLLWIPISFILTVIPAFYFQKFLYYTYEKYRN